MGPFAVISPMYALWAAFYSFLSRLWLVPQMLDTLKCPFLMRTRMPTVMRL